MSLNTGTFDLISYEVAKVRNLMAALELATEGMLVPDDDLARRQRDATVGVVDAMAKQLDELDRVIQEHTQQALASDKAA